MRHTLTTLALALSLSAGAVAQEMCTKVSESFQEKLSDDLGEREADILIERLESKLSKAFERAGLDVAKVKLTIEDAKPNRPTFEQLSDKPGLDPIRSISIGGAKISGVAYDDTGAEIAALTYDWYSHDIRDSVGVGTWADANRAISSFSRRFAKELTAHHQSASGS